MQTEPLVSIIVVNFNGKKYLKNCFDSIYDGNYKNIEIIFVDNGSCDDSLEFVRQNYKNVRILENRVNLGLAAASNKGAQISSGEYLFFYNNDTIANTKLIGNLTKAMQQDLRLGIAGCKTYTYNGEHLINAGIACDILGYPYGEGNPFYVDAGIFIRRELFHKIGGFDERYFLYCEDADFGLRIAQGGYHAFLIAEASMIHFAGQSAYQNPLTQLYFVEAYLYYINKNLTFFHRVAYKTCFFPLVIGWAVRAWLRRDQIQVRILLQSLKYFNPSWLGGMFYLPEHHK